VATHACGLERRVPCFLAGHIHFSTIIEQKLCKIRVATCARIVQCTASFWRNGIYIGTTIKGHTCRRDITMPARYLQDCIHIAAAFKQLLDH